MLPAYVLDLLRRQRGLVARHQIRSEESNRNARRRIYRHSELESVTRRVLRHRAVPPSPEQDLLAATLDAGPGSVLWSKSGATHWGFGRHRLLPPHVAVDRRSPKGEHLGQLHVVRHLEDDERVTYLDVPVARPESLVLWLAGMRTHRFGHDLAERWGAIELDHAWRQRLIDGQFIHELAARSGGYGRSGIVVLRQLLATRPPDYQPAGSRLEERFEEIVGADVVRHIERQVTVDAERAIRTVDYRARNAPKVIEINGEAFHSSITDRAADVERYERLVELGFSVLVLWEYDIWHERRVVRNATRRFLDRPDDPPTVVRPTKAPWEW